jgi:hypothetical protein
LVVSAYSSYKSEKSNEFKAAQEKQRKTELDTFASSCDDMQDQEPVKEMFFSPLWNPISTCC